MRAIEAPGFGMARRRRAHAWRAAFPLLAVLAHGACAGPSPAPPPVVRVVYVIPRDRPFRADYRDAVAVAIADLQRWYRSQMDGRTFALHRTEPEVCRLPSAADYYSVDSWSKVEADVRSCVPVSNRAEAFAWLLYVDVVHACDAPGRLGSGRRGLAMVARQDLEGLIGARVFDDCGKEWVLPITRYVGGAGHELGHALGLRHPPGCDAASPDCDRDALMWSGYVGYPDTYLRPADRAILAASPFIR